MSTSGQEANGDSEGPAISDDGRFVAFQSSAFFLVPDDNNFTTDVFVRDRLTGTTERVSVSSAGAEANNISFFADISADGRFVTFTSGADNLVPGDTHFVFQVYLHDRATGTTELVSQDASGDGGNFNSAISVISDDGRFVAFETNATNLIPDGSPPGQVLVRDRLTGTMERASVDNAGNAGNEFSGRPNITADGRFVAFQSLASNLVVGDTNGRPDIFVRDRQSRTTVRVSVSTSGAEANSESERAKISDDGLVIAFQSFADNLVPDDTGPTTDIFVHDDRPAADLSVSTTDAPDPVGKGGALTYNVVVTNSGPGSAAGVELTDQLSADVRFVSVTFSAGSCAQAAGAITCELGSLGAGANATVTIVVTARRVGTITNIAQVSSPSPDPNQANNTNTEATTVTR